MALEWVYKADVLVFRARSVCEGFGKEPCQFLHLLFASVQHGAVEGKGLAPATQNRMPNAWPCESYDPGSYDPAGPSRPGRPSRPDREASAAWAARPAGPAKAGRAVRPARRPGWPGLAWLACPPGQQGRPGRPGQPSRPGRPSRPTYVLTYVRTYERASVLTYLPLANSVSQLALAPTIAKYEKGLDGATKDPLTNLQLLPIRCSGNLGGTRICCCTKKECPYDWLRHGDCHFTTGFGTAVANAGGWLVGGHGSCQLGGPPLHD